MLIPIVEQTELSEATAPSFGSSMWNGVANPDWTSQPRCRAAVANRLKDGIVVFELRDFLKLLLVDGHSSYS